VPVRRPGRKKKEKRERRIAGHQYLKPETNAAGEEKRKRPRELVERHAYAWLCAAKVGGREKKERKEGSIIPLLRRLLHPLEKEEGNGLNVWHDSKKDKRETARLTMTILHPPGPKERVTATFLAEGQRGRTCWSCCAVAGKQKKRRQKEFVLARRKGGTPRSPLVCPFLGRKGKRKAYVLQFLAFEIGRRERVGQRSSCLIKILLRFSTSGRRKK